MIDGFQFVDEDGLGVGDVAEGDGDSLCSPRDAPRVPW